MGRMRLFGEPGWGSAIVEAQLDWYGLEHDFERVGNLFESDGAGRERLAAELETAPQGHDEGDPRHRPRAPIGKPFGKPDSSLIPA